jgi:hypothetical protein
VLAGKPWNEPRVEMNEYDLVGILGQFAEHGMREIVVVPEPHGNCDTAILLGRKAPAVD